MRKWGFALYVGLFGVGMTLSCFATGPISHVIVADPELDAGQLANIVRRAGNVEGVGSDGFLDVRIRGTFDSAKRKLRDLGIQHVLPAESRSIETDDLVAVDRHIAYLTARNSLRLGLLDMEEAEGSWPRVGFYDALRSFLEKRAEPNGKLMSGRWIAASEDRSTLPVWKTTGLWEFVGPENLMAPSRPNYGIGPVSGRKSTIAVAKGNTDLIYTGGPGGLFKSSDGGKTFASVSDRWLLPQCSAVAIDPKDSNVVYAGTGDALMAPFGYGIMKTVDGGRTWRNAGRSEFDSAVVERIRIDPRDSKVILASAAGPKGGLFRSTDAGATWSRVLSHSRGIQGLDLASDGKTWWATTSGSTREGNLFRSTNGMDWERLSLPPGAHEGRVDLACSKVSANSLFVLSTGDQRIYRTRDAGKTWDDVSDRFPSDKAVGDGYNWSQKHYDAFIGTAKCDQGEALLVGLITVCASFDGGDSWTDIARTFHADARIHSDQHCYVATRSGQVLLGNDGGIYRAQLDGRASKASFQSLNASLGDIAFYSVAVNPVDSNSMMGGAQDNGTPARDSSGQWSTLPGGDGGWCAYDHRDPKVRYTSSQFLGVYRADRDLKNISPTVSEPPAFSAPLVMGGNGSIVFAAGRGHLMETDGSGRWTRHEQDIAGTGQVKCLATAPSNPNVIYSGADNGQIWFTRDQGTTFLRVDEGLPDEFVSAIAVDPKNSEEIVVASGNDGKLYRGRLTGSRMGWTALTSRTLPRVPINAVVIDPKQSQRIFIGTDVGVFASENGGLTWANAGAAGLPNVMVTDLEFDASGRYLNAATFGRGIWRIAVR